MTAAAPRPPAVVARPAVLAGIDVLEEQAFASLRGRRIALLTNQTGRTRRGQRTVDALATAPGVRLVALFSPEHGIRGQLDEAVPSSRDERTDLPIYSLYGDARRPTASMLAGVDAVVVDLQDVGVRFYTYAATTAYVMEEAARAGVPVIVLDRPNPIGGEEVEGPVQDSDQPALTGYVPMPIRHGLTLGELARLFNGERGLGADLTVVAMRHWSRRDWFDETGLRWVNPSPNLRSLRAAALYPGLGMIEGTNISVGRGTEAPFERVGAPWIDGRALAAALQMRGMPGVRFDVHGFTPEVGAMFGGQPLGGVSMAVTDRKAMRPVRVGLEIASALSRMYGTQFELERAAVLLGSQRTIDRIRAGDDPGAIARSWDADEQAWRRRRDRYLLY